MIFDNGEFKIYDEVINEFVVVPVTTVPVNDLLEAWSSLITELSSDEIKYYQLKESYRVQSENIIATTDFKQLYGKNNESVRKTHVKKELEDIVKEYKSLEFSIDYLKREISFLKQLIYTRTVIMEIKE